MMYNLLINQKKAQEWELTTRASLGMNAFVALSFWATPVVVDGKVYYTLYRSKLMDELPLLGKSVGVASKIIQELEDKQIIESINKATTPAYKLTNKGKEWLSDTALEKSNDGENKDLQKTQTPKKSEKFTFRLKKATEYSDLTDEYLGYLKVGCLTYAKEVGLKPSEYESFVNKWKADGKVYKDWASAFKTWCSNSKKFDKNKGTKKSNDSENQPLDNVEL